MIPYDVLFIVGFFIIGMLVASGWDNPIWAIISLILGLGFLYDMKTQEVVKVFERNVTISLKELATKELKNVKVVYTDKVKEPVLNIPYCILKSKIAESDIRVCSDFKNNKFKEILYFPQKTLDKEGK